MNSPTVATESVFISTEVDSHEVWYVVTFEILGSYLHTEIDKGIILLLEGAIAELMMNVSLKIYHKYAITIRKGKPLLYVQIKNSLYGLIFRALLFYRKLMKYLDAYFFV